MLLRCADVLLAPADGKPFREQAMTLKSDAEPAEFRSTWYIWRQGILLDGVRWRAWLCLNWVVSMICPDSTAQNLIALAMTYARRLIEWFGLAAYHIRPSFHSVACASKKRSRDEWESDTPRPTLSEAQWAASLPAVLTWLVLLQTSHSRWKPPGIGAAARAVRLFRCIVEWIVSGRTVALEVLGTCVVLVIDGAVDMGEFRDSQIRSGLNYRNFVLKDHKDDTMRLPAFLFLLAKVATGRNATVTSGAAGDILRECIRRLALLAEAVVQLDAQWHEDNFLAVGVPIKAGKAGRISGGQKQERLQLIRFDNASIGLV